MMLFFWQNVEIYMFLTQYFHNVSIPSLLIIFFDESWNIYNIWTSTLYLTLAMLVENSLLWNGHYTHITNTKFLQLYSGSLDLLNPFYSQHHVTWKLKTAFFFSISNQQQHNSSHCNQHTWNTWRHLLTPPT